MQMGARNTHWRDALSERGPTAYELFVGEGRGGDVVCMQHGPEGGLGGLFKKFQLLF